MTIGFHASEFECHPVQYEVPEGETPPEPGTEPAAMLEFRSGQNLALHIPISMTDAEGMMGAFTQAEPMRQQLPPEALNWQPEQVGLPEGMFWVLTPQLVGMSVTPPQQMPDGLVPYWTVAFARPGRPWRVRSERSYARGRRGLIARPRRSASRA